MTEDKTQDLILAANALLSVIPSCCNPKSPNGHEIVSIAMNDLENAIKLITKEDV